MRLPWSTKRECALMRYQGLEQRSPWMFRRQRQHPDTNGNHTVSNLTLRLTTVNSKDFVGFAPKKYETSYMTGARISPIASESEPRRPSLLSAGEAP